MKFDIIWIKKIIAIIKTIFWKNPNIIYINSNKKKFDKGDVDSHVEVRNRKWVLCQTDSKLGFKFEKHHFKKMKFCLFQILRNCSDVTSIVYAGYVSPMFAICDGYCLGDSRNYVFVDTRKSKSESYEIRYKKKFIKQDIDFDYSSEEINVLVNSSSDIALAKCKKCKTYFYNEKCKDKIDNQYLTKVYSFIKSLLDLSTNSSVKRVNLYVSSRQPVSFVIGTAIQSSHPPVFVYEFDQGEYKDQILLQEGKIIEEKI